MRLSDPAFEKYYVQARLETLRGGKPLWRRRRIPRSN